MIKGELFSQPFIPKLLDGTKIRTSRLCKPLTLNYPMRAYENETPEQWLARWNHKPKYQPGDIMYVRETWQSFFPEEVTEHHQQGPRSFSGIPAETAKGHCMYFYYRADGEVPPDPKYGKACWMPSIHMPREAARIFMRVTDVKVQHIDTMTEQDAVDDGFDDSEDIPGTILQVPALEQFKLFWWKQYGPDAKWMWVYYFERISKEEDDHER